MSVNSYLVNLADAAIIRDREKESIQRSISALQGKLALNFSNQLSKHFIFGSYSRGTILPRKMDARSDIDYMIIFSDSRYTPQTYLNQLRRFVEAHYSSSEIAQSNPTIVLSLNHIRFELVPAVHRFLVGLQIPAKASEYQNWIKTDPTGFNKTISAKNQAHNNLIKPLVRLVKYWNACNKYPFDSYEIEQEIVRKNFSMQRLFNAQLKDYLNNFVQGVSLDPSNAQCKKDAFYRLKSVLAAAISHEKNYPLWAEDEINEDEIKKLFPPVA